MKSSRRYVFPAFADGYPSVGFPPVDKRRLVDQSEPGGYVATASEHAAVTDRGDHGRGDHRTNARNRRGAATQRRSLGPLGQVTRGLGNLAVERELSLPEPMDYQGEAG